MTTRIRRPAVIEFPSDLEIVLTRQFDAPRELVFDVLWKPEYLIKTMAPFGEEVTVCDVDLRVGGDYHFVFVPDGGAECSFRGTFLEVDPPARTVQTWLFEGWPDAPAVESMDLQQDGAGTTMTWSLTFQDAAGRARMTRFDGVQASFDHVEDLLWSLLDQQGSR